MNWEALELFLVKLGIIPKIKINQDGVDFRRRIAPGLLQL